MNYFKSVYSSWIINKYFFRYIFSAKNRQKILILALASISLSSFALIILQSSMGGLQNNLTTRSKKVDGNAYVRINQDNMNLVKNLEEELLKLNLNFEQELMIEALIKNGSLLSGVRLHGISPDNRFYKTFNVEGKGAVVGYDLSEKLRMNLGDRIQIISPNHLNLMIEEVPRVVTTEFSSAVTTDVPERDIFDAWAPITTVQNLIRSKSFNIIRIFGDTNYEKLKEHLLAKYNNQLQLRTWKDDNETLFYAFSLETKVMNFLFVMMSFLVGISIVTGLLIFFDKIKTDLTSFWILGAHKKALDLSAKLFLQLIAITASGSGLLMGLVLLELYKIYPFIKLPSVFVDQHIPVFIRPISILTSFFIPYLICIVFGTLAISKDQRERFRPLSLLRSYS